MVENFENCEEQIPVYEKWDEYNLKEEILHAIFGLGFETPSFIQKTAIMPIIQGRDIRAQAQSGTGKTAAFGVAALQRLGSEKATQVLILVSTREMAEQNAHRIKTLAKHMNINIVTLSGGIGISQNKGALADNPEIVVGTPGRVMHMLKSGFLKTDSIKLCIIDEADEMMSKGFEEQICGIFEFLREDMQVAMFSATWEKPEMDVAAQILNDPVVIDLRQDEQTLKGIDQYYVSLGQRSSSNFDQLKINALVDLFSTKKVGQCIVFVGKKSRADYVSDKLNKNKIPSSVIHGDIDSDGRSDVLNKFRDGSTRLLIATKVLSRGIDIQQLNVVINFDLPKQRDPTTGEVIMDKSNYIHRIGRAGRFGRKGIAINLVFDDELKDLKEIEDHYRTNISPLPSKLELQ